ncbi:MAG: TetR/AcrR family transcriptional regulator [Chloroflexi bacterium]|nr:TetR/AcrR family transcriptional regulator [Chloroflexota bacterium]
MTREAILEAAAQIISEKGFHAASMQDIAEAVNLQKASLYHHVTSKQEILVELLDRALAMLTERLEGILAEPMTPEEHLRAALRSYLEALVEHRDLAAVLLLEHRSLEPLFHQRHIPRRDRFEALWRGILDEGVAAGAFASDDSRMAVKMVLGTANWTIMWFRPGGEKTARQIADATAELLINGLAIRPPSGN